MGKTSWDLEDQLSPVLRAGNLDECESVVLTKLRSLPSCPFHIILDLEITISTPVVARYFDDFFRQQPRDQIRAAYTEMNGFDINPGLWFCSPFAYARYGGHDDYDWLANWQSEDYDILPITGLEPLQQVYAGEAFRNQDFNDAADITSLLVVVKFQKLIRDAATSMQELRFPILATAHDYNFIYEFRPETL